MYRTYRRLSVASRDGLPRHMMAVAYIVVICIFAVITPVCAKKTVINHLHYYWHAEAWLNFLQKAAKDFMEENPDIEIKVSVGGASEAYLQKVMVMAAAGIPPDITEFSPASGASPMAEGFFRDLRPFIEKDKLNLQAFTPAAIRGYTWFDGRIWALPADIYPDVVFYNSDLIEEAGLLAPPRLGNDWNWAAMAEMGRKLTRDTNGDGKIDQYGVDRADAMWSRNSALQQAGARLYDRYVNPTESRYNSPEVAKALRFVADLFLTYRVVNTSREFYFWTGKTAIDPADGPGIIGPYLTKVDFEWDIALQPSGPAGTGTRAMPNGWQISAQCKNPEAAWKWVKYLAYSQKAVYDFISITGRFPSILVTQMRYNQFIKHAPKSWKVFGQAANHPNSFGGYVIPKSSEIDPIVSDYTGRVFRGQMSVEEALNHIHKKVGEILKK